MPHIKQVRRDALVNASDEDGDDRILNSGELNYSFTMLIKDYLFNQGECYQTYNDIIGALEGAKLELYRKKIVPYENKKIKENGDVYKG